MTRSLANAMPSHTVRQRAIHSAQLWPGLRANALTG